MLFKCLLFVQKKDYKSASQFLSDIKLYETDYVTLYNKLSTAVENNDILEVNTEELNISAKSQEGIPNFSFVKQAEVDGESFSQLVTDFYTEGLYDSKERCIIARKIYTSIINDTRRYFKIYV